MTHWSFCWTRFVLFLFGGVGVGVTHHSCHNRTSGKPNGARVFARNSTPTFEMSRASQPRKCEVRPYGCFFAAARVIVVLSDCRLSFCCFFCGDKKKCCWILKTLCHDLHGWNCPVGQSDDTWQTDNGVLKLQWGFIIPGNEAKCNNHSEFARMHCNNLSQTLVAAIQGS